MTRWIVVAVTGFLIAGCSSKKEAPKRLASAVEQSGRTEPARAVAPLPGTEAAHRLLAGVGHGAATADGTAVALGGVFGKGGVLGGGPARGLGLASDTSAVTPDNGDDPPAATKPPPDVAVPPPASAGGDCTAVGARIGELATAMMAAEMRDISDDARAMTERMVSETLAQVPAMIETACRSQAWPQALVDCLLTGADLAVLQACERFATPQMKAEAEAATTAAAGSAPPGQRPSTPAPAWNGASRDCAAAAQHAADVIEWEMTGAPSDVTAELLVQVKQGVAASCPVWPASVTECTLDATSLVELDACAATGP